MIVIINIVIVRIDIIINIIIMLIAIKIVLMTNKISIHIFVDIDNFADIYLAVNMKLHC